MWRFDPAYFRFTVTSRAAQWCVMEEWVMTSLLPGHGRIDVERCDHRIMNSILTKVIEKKLLKSLEGCDPWIVSSILSRELKIF